MMRQILGRGEMMCGGRNKGAQIHAEGPCSSGPDKLAGTSCAMVAEAAFSELVVAPSASTAVRVQFAILQYMPS
jgi:hypothetical protein